MTIKHRVQCVSLVLCSFVFAAAADKPPNDLQRRSDQMKENATTQEDDPFRVTLRAALKGSENTRELAVLLLQGVRPSQEDMEFLAHRYWDTGRKETVTNLINAFRATDDLDGPN